MRNYIKINKLSLITILLFALMVMMPDTAWASHLKKECAGKDIFGTMRCMVAYTLYDLRYIIYIVGGLGLIAFAYGAIFGKLSFKHLANICFSLFLVSMMSPFIRYFSGSDTAVPELTYKDYLSKDGDISDDSGYGDAKDGKIGGGPKMLDLDGVLVSYGSSGKESEEEDTRTTLQKIRDGFNKAKEETQKAANTISSVKSAAENIGNTVTNVANAVSNIENVEDLLVAAQIAADGVGNIAGNAVMGAGAIGGYTDQNMINTNRSNIETAQKKIEDNQANIAKNRQQIDALQANAFNVEQELNRLRQTDPNNPKIQEYETYLEDLNDKISELERWNAMMQAEINQLNKDIENWNNEIQNNTLQNRTADALGDVTDGASDVGNAAGSGRQIGNTINGIMGNLGIGK